MITISKRHLLVGMLKGRKGIPLPMCIFRVSLNSKKIISPCYGLPTIFTDR